MIARSLVSYITIAVLLTYDIDVLICFALECFSYHESQIAYFGVVYNVFHGWHNRIYQLLTDWLILKSMILYINVSMRHLYLVTL